MSGSRTEEKREEAKRWRFQQNAGSAATSAAGAVIRAVLPATSARMKRKWKHGLRTLPAAVKIAAASAEIIAAAARVILTLGLIPSAAVKTGAAASGITADAKTDAVAGITAAVRTSAAVANVMHGMS